LRPWITALITKDTAVEGKTNRDLIPSVEGLGVRGRRRRHHQPDDQPETLTGAAGPSKRRPRGTFDQLRRRSPRVGRGVDSRRGGLLAEGARWVRPPPRMASVGARGGRWHLRMWYTGDDGTTSSILTAVRSPGGGWDRPADLCPAAGRDRRPSDRRATEARGLPHVRRHGPDDRRALRSWRRGVAHDRCGLGRARDDQDAERSHVAPLPAATSCRALPGNIVLIDRERTGSTHLSDCANTSCRSSCACHGPGGVVVE
jgi:hypothetical protein